LYDLFCPRDASTYLKEKPAHGRFDHYPAQENPPLELQLLPLEAALCLDEPPSAAKTDIFFFVFLLWHAGQACAWSASEKRTIFSNSSPQS
jgi:hypothetical protein